MATILYQTDHNHSYGSREIIGVFTNKKKYHQTVRAIIKQKADPDERQWNLQFFIDHGQTQGLNSFELDSEEIEMNVKI